MEGANRVFGSITVPWLHLFDDTAICTDVIPCDAVFKLSFSTDASFHRDSHSEVKRSLLLCKTMICSRDHKATVGFCHVTSNSLAPALSGSSVVCPSMLQFLNFGSVTGARHVVGVCLTFLHLLR